MAGKTARDSVIQRLLDYFNGNHVLMAVLNDFESGEEKCVREAKPTGLRLGADANVDYVTSFELVSKEAVATRATLLLRAALGPGGSETVTADTVKKALAKVVKDGKGQENWPIKLVQCEGKVYYCINPDFNTRGLLG